MWNHTHTYPTYMNKKGIRIESNEKNYKFLVGLNKNYKIITCYGFRSSQDLSVRKREALCSFFITVKCKLLRAWIKRCVLLGINLIF